MPDKSEDPPVPQLGSLESTEARRWSRNEDRIEGCGSTIATAKPLLEGKLPVGAQIRAHLSIARFDHVAKNVFIIPGILIPLTLEPQVITKGLATRVVVGFISASLVACSNYVINELLDAPYDRFHPSKKNRPVVTGLVNAPLAYVQWLAMMAIGIALGVLVSKPFVVMLFILWIMGGVYNIPPIRTKDLVYLDVLSESLNNPIRLLLGWYIVTTVLIPPLSLITSYWMVGCYFMALKRTSEFREIGNSDAFLYRRSYRHYTEESLMVSVMFYASAAMLFFGAFIIRYKIELILSFPLVAHVMAVYLRLSYERGSAVQNPEKLHRSPRLLISAVGCATVMLALLRVNIPWMETFFKPMLPISAGK